MGISDRLQEERKRLGLTQEAAAEKLGATKRSVINWEGGASLPGAEVLAGYAAAGADVLYILTGQRTGAVARSTASALSSRKAALLDNYDAADETGKRYIERAADLEAQSGNKKAARGGE